MKRTIALFTVGLATALLAVGCTSPGTSGAGTSPSASATSVSDATRTIVDHTGNEVVIPTEITRVAVDEIPIASTYVAYFEGSAPHLVGMSEAVVQSLSGTVVAEMVPEILDVDTSYYSDGDLNIESLLTLTPDVVFYNANNTDHAALFKSAGIPAVGFSTSGDPAEVYEDWLRLLEQVFNEPGKMDAVIDYGSDLITDAQERVADLPADERRTVLIIFNYGSGVLRIAGETPFFGYYWLERIQADNAAVGAEGGLAPVTAEQIYEWDPDVVLVGGSGQALITPKQILDNTVDGLDLTPLKAVTDGHVHSNDLGMWSWFTPNPDAPVILNWLGSVIYPEQFRDVDVESMTKDYYQQVYHFELSNEQASNIVRGASGDE